MRSLGFLVFVPFFSMAQKQQSDTASGIQFQQNESWSEVREMAKKENKFILVDCYASWCGPCKEMDRQTYTDEHVGALVNQSFVSIKIQCDTTKADPRYIKARYSDGHTIVKEFKVYQYPTILFFSPDGKLVHKGVGFHSPGAFIKLIETARDPQRQYYTLIREYTNGRLGYDRMVYLAELADQYDDKLLRMEVIRKFIQEYLNKLQDSAFYKKENLDILREYLDAFRTDDKLVKWLSRHSVIVDSIFQKKGLASKIYDQVIFCEKVKPAMDKARETGDSPDWRLIGENIDKGFGNEHYDAILLGKIEWYQSINDSENLAGALAERIDNLSGVKDISDPANRETLNLYAFGIFQNSNDKSKLEKALNWIDLSLGAMVDSSLHAAEFIDTKANLLYKLGRRDEAISLESKSAKIKPYDAEIAANLQRMKEGKPTW